MHLSPTEEVGLSVTPGDDKEAALRRHHALNPRPEGVRDAAFTSADPFFDARDLVQVKYEMLRRAREEGSTVSDAATTFGFSRPSFYEAKAAYDTGGLPGLLPKRPGPRRAHKLSDAVVERLEEALAADSSLTSTDLAGLAEAEFGLHVHPRSVERALARRPKDRRGPTS
jgi:transposase